MFKELFGRWPVVKQIQTGDFRAAGKASFSDETKNLRARFVGAKMTKSVCPYCGVGCGQVVFSKGNEIVQIEGDPDSPISRGRLCPKGANTKELHTHAKRLMSVKYRRPHGTAWEEIPLERAMDMVADRLWEARECNFVEEQDGKTLMQNKTVAHLGGATLDNEENYLIKKLFTGGLGMVCISNQARI
jgi:formate dehydrogenase major subunit